MMEPDLRNNRADIDRRERTSIPEVVLAKFKDENSLKTAIDQLLSNGKVLITKCSQEQVDFLKDRYASRLAFTDPLCGVAIVGDEDTAKKDPVGTIAIFSAGSSDYPMAEEAAISAEFLGLRVVRFYVVGVAGLQRIEEALTAMADENVQVVIVVAGMEGALPSVVAGQIRQPLIAVPTSIGYGANFEGITPLLSMLNSCAPGVAVVNIDNGFGAAAFAYKSIRQGSGSSRRM